MLRKKMYCYCIKYKQGEKSQKPWSKDVAQCISSVNHDESVILVGVKSCKSKVASSCITRELYNG